MAVINESQWLMKIHQQLVHPSTPMLVREKNLIDN